MIARFFRALALFGRLPIVAFKLARQPKPGEYLIIWVPDVVMDPDEIDSLSEAAQKLGRPFIIVPKEIEFEFRSDMFSDPRPEQEEGRDAIVMAADAAKAACILRIQRAIDATKRLHAMPLNAEECIALLEHMTWDELPHTAGAPIPDEYEDLS